MRPPIRNAIMFGQGTAGAALHQHLYSSTLPTYTHRQGG